MTNSITYKEKKKIKSIIFNKNKPIALRKKIKMPPLPKEFKKIVNNQPASFVTSNNSINNSNTDKKSINTHMTLKSLKHLGNVFNSSVYKKTFIIDNEGNNNGNIEANLLLIASDIQLNNIASHSNDHDNNNKEKHGEYKKIFELLNKNINYMKSIVKGNNMVNK